MGLPLTEHEAHWVILIERVSAAFSLFWVLSIFITFACFRTFRTLTTTMLLLASFSNIGAIVACLIGGAALTDLESSLCKLQAFLLEWCMASDPIWGANMAMNVFLVFFYRWTQDELLKLIPIYCATGYGIPLIAAIVCLTLKTERGPIIGDAQLWCWISNAWAPVRLYSYYIIVWIACVFSMFVYIAVGFKIRQVRNAVKKAGSDSYGSGSKLTDSTARTSACGQSSAFSGLKTTDVEVDSHIVIPANLLQIPRPTYNNRNKPTTHPNSISNQALLPTYRVSISAQSPKPRRRWYHRPSNVDETKWNYGLTACIYFASILVVWTPSSANRVYQIVHPNLKANYGLSIAAALVLPLQGFFNASIYYWALRENVKAEWKIFAAKWHGSWGRRILAGAVGDSDSISKSKVDGLGTYINGNLSSSTDSSGDFDFEIGGSTRSLGGTLSGFGSSVER